MTDEPSESDEVESDEEEEEEQVLPEVELPTIRVVSIVVRDEGDHWEHEIDVPDSVSTHEAYAMIEAAYFKIRAEIYPGMFPDPTAMPLIARLVSDDEDEYEDEDEDADGE
jgi:hypothetical protein